MSFRQVITYASSALAFAVWVVMAPSAVAVEPSATAASVELFQPFAAACHPSQGPCTKPASPAIASVSATIASAPEGPFDRYGVSSTCHPGYTPSWLTCAGRVRTARLAELK